MSTWSSNIEENLDRFLNHYVRNVTNLSSRFAGDITDADRQIEIAVKSVGAQVAGWKQFITLAAEIQKAGSDTVAIQNAVMKAFVEDKAKERARNKVIELTAKKKKEIISMMQIAGIKGSIEFGDADDSNLITPTIEEATNLAVQALSAQISNSSIWNNVSTTASAVIEGLNQLLFDTDVYLRQLEKKRMSIRKLNIILKDPEQIINSENFQALTEVWQQDSDQQYRENMLKVQLLIENFNAALVATTGATLEYVYVVQETGEVYGVHDLSSLMRIEHSSRNLAGYSVRFRAGMVQLQQLNETNKIEQLFQELSDSNVQSDAEMIRETYNTSLERYDTYNGLILYQKDGKWYPFKVSSRGDLSEGYVAALYDLLQSLLS